MSSFILTMRNVNYLGEIMQDEELICFILTMRNVNINGIVNVLKL